MGACIGAVLGALVFFACSVTCYGQGLISHWSLLPDAMRGAGVGGICGLLHIAMRRRRPMLFIPVCGVACGLIALLVAVVMFSQMETAPMNRAELWQMLRLMSLYHALAGALTGTAIAYVPHWIMDQMRCPQTVEVKDGEELSAHESIY